MIVDIVELPRRLRQFKGREALISSQLLYPLPISSITREYGYNDYHDEDWFEFGTKIILPTGDDAMFRYKFMEPIKDHVVEYFVLTQSPIDVRRPLRNKRVKCFCPWIDVVNTKTFQVKHYTLWNHVFALNHFEVEDSVVDAPVEGVITNEVSNFAKAHGWTDMVDQLKNYKYPSRPDGLLISETRFVDDDIDSLLMWRSNMQAYRDMMSMCDPCHWLDVCDVMRGVNIPQIITTLESVKGCTLLRRILSGPFMITDIAHMFGMHYDVHMFSRPFNPNPLDPFTEIDIPTDDNRSLFEILKYIGRLPYSEFTLTLNKTGLCDFKLYNPYCLGMQIDNANGDHMTVIKPVVDELTSVIRDKFNHLKTMTITKSWGNDVFITITYDNTEIRDRFYYDKVAVALGSRTLIRDYEPVYF